MQDYLQSIAADAPPSMFAVGADWSTETYAALGEAIGQKIDEVKGITAENAQAAKEAAAARPWGRCR